MLPILKKETIIFMWRSNQLVYLTQAHNTLKLSDLKL